MNFEGIDFEWLGHSGVLIRTRKENIFIDPYKVSAGVGSIKADLILITHSHYDHCSLEDLKRIIKKNTIIVIPADCQSKLARLNEEFHVKLLESGQEIKLEISGEKMKIKAVPAYNINKNFHGKAEYWNGYVLEIEGKKIYHAGDTDLIPEMSNLEGVDIAFLPVGGTYTMNADEASRAVTLIRPKLAVPIHYGDVVGSEEDALRFVDLCEREGFNALKMNKK